MSDNENRIVTRCAPQWAWDLIDETLMMHANSNVIDRDLREMIDDALRGMVYASENPTLTELSAGDIPAEF